MKFQIIPNDGYDPDEVDEYIAKISQSYDQLHDACTAQQGRIRQLVEEMQLEKSENARLAAENDKLRDEAATPVQAETDTSVVAQLLLDAEIFAKRIKDQSQAEADRRLAETETKIRALELKKESVLRTIKRLTNDLIMLTGGKYEDTFTGGTQSGVRREFGEQKTEYTADEGRSDSGNV